MPARCPCCCRGSAMPAGPPGRTMVGAVEAIAGADMLIIGGTSLAVYPAAGLIRYYRGNRLALINKSATPYDREAGLVINASLGEVLGAIRV